MELLQMIGKKSRLVLLLAVAVACGCEEAVLPEVRTEMPFSLYGVISPDLARQSIMVFPIEGLLEPATPGLLGAAMTSTNLQTGEARRWQDSLTIDEATGHFRHIYWSPFRAEYGSTYRFEITGSDSRSTLAEVRVPPEMNLVLLEPRMVDPAHIMLPILAEGGPPELVAPTRFLKVQVKYKVKYWPGPPSEHNTYETGWLDTAYPQPQVAEGRLVELNLSVERTRIEREQFFRHPPGADSLRIHGLVLLDISLRMIVATEDWTTPGDLFEEEMLGQPDMLWNVQNGYGFVGAGYRRALQWLPAEPVQKAAGFRLMEEQG